MNSNKAISSIEQSKYGEMPSVAFVIPYFGKLPAYAYYFIASCRYNEFIDFHFYTNDKIDIRLCPENVFFHKMTLTQFNKLCSQKLNVELSYNNPYKLCDLKPMYGAIFENDLKPYDFWGFCDFDMILGNLKKVITPKLLEEFDIICVKQAYASGPFTILKNKKNINWFFRCSKDWQDVLFHPNYQKFDEAGDAIAMLWQGKDIWQCESSVESFTHLLKNNDLILKHEILVYMEEVINESLGLDKHITFNKGTLIGTPSQKEYFIFHYIIYKNQKLFNEKWLNNVSKEFFKFTRYGFANNNLLTFLWGLGVSLISRYKYRFLKKIKLLKYS